MTFFERAWAEVDLTAARENIGEIKKRLAPSTALMAVVKADAYGCGGGYIRALIGWGVEHFAVSNLEEARQVRELGAKGIVLILGVTPPEYAGELARFALTQTVFSLSYGEKLSAFAEQSGVKVSCHLKADTGMGRIGFDAFSLSLEEMERVCSLPGLQIKGAFTHFSSADDLSAEGKAYTAAQIERFEQFIKQAEQFTGKLLEVHAQNSAGILNYPELRYDLARGGIILYGLPVETEKEKQILLKPVLALKSVTAMVKKIPGGRSIGYSRRYTTDKDTVIATVPVGYADGYSRLLSGKAEVIIRGKRAKIIGNICMDQMMVDVTEIPGVQEGDVVTLVGRDGDEEISFLELADKQQTIHYELSCAVGKRVPRVYLENGKIVGVEDYYHSAAIREQDSRRPLD